MNKKIFIKYLQRWPWTYSSKAAIKELMTDNIGESASGSASCGLTFANSGTGESVSSMDDLWNNYVSDGNDFSDSKNGIFHTEVWFEAGETGFIEFWVDNEANATTSSIPEPSCLILFFTCSCLLGLAGLKKKKEVYDTDW